MLVQLPLHSSHFVKMRRPFAPLWSTRLFYGVKRLRARKSASSNTHRIHCNAFLLRTIFFKCNNQEFIASNKKVNRHNDLHVAKLTYLSLWSMLLCEKCTVFSTTSWHFVNWAKPKQTVMTQKLQKLQNKQRGRGGAIVYCKNIAQISRSPRKKVR